MGCPLRGSRGPQQGFYHPSHLVAKWTLGTQLRWHPVVAAALSDVGWLQELWATRDCGLFLTVLGQRRRREDCSTVLGAPGGVVWLNKLSALPVGIWEISGRGGRWWNQSYCQVRGAKGTGRPCETHLGGRSQTPSLSLSSPCPQVSLFLILMASGYFLPLPY